MRTKPYQTAIALFDEVELLDVAGPIAVLSAAGRNWNFQPFKVDRVADSVGPISTRSSLLLEATHNTALYAGAECLIILGGYGARRAAESEAMLNFIRRSLQSAQWVAAIGSGVLLLAKAGLLEAHTLAASPELGADITAALPSARIDSHSPLCVSGKILSTQKTALGLDLACEIVARCYGQKAGLEFIVHAGHRLVWRIRRAGHRARPDAAEK